MLDLRTVLLRNRHDERDLHVHAIDGHPGELADRTAAGEIERFLQDAGMLQNQASQCCTTSKASAAIRKQSIGALYGPFR